MHLTAAAAEGRLVMQCCGECNEALYPPRDACSNCLGTDLSIQDIASGGQLIAETTIHASPRLFFRERLPWRTGTIKLDAGTVILAHVHPDVTKHARVQVEHRLDRAGQGVFLALPEQATPHMEDEPMMRELSANPKHRRIFLTDAKSPHAPALAQALLKAGASEIFEANPKTGDPIPTLQF